MAGESLLDLEMLDASGNDRDNQDGDKGSGGAGVSLEENMREESPMPREGGLIEGMEREAMEAGAGGWYNGLDQEIDISKCGGLLFLSLLQVKGR